MKVHRDAIKSGTLYFRNILTQWQKVPYRKAVMQEIRTEMKFLEPYKPQLSELVIVGTKIDNPGEFDSVTQKKSNESRRTEGYGSDRSDNFTLEEENKFISTTPELPFMMNPIPRINFKINGHEISPEIGKGHMKIRITFLLNEIPELPLQKFIEFENRGQTAIRISFTKFEKFVTFRDIIPFKRRSSPFYFNKSELTLTSAQLFQLPIWFKPTKTGHFIEAWKVSAKPNFFPSDFLLTIVFQGIAYHEDYFEKSVTIKKTLDDRIRLTLIEEIVEDVIESTKYEQRQTCTYTFSDKDLFESMNIEKWGAAKRRTYLYDKNIVQSLTRLYYSARSTEDTPYWNFSIKTLKDVVRKRDILDFINQLYKECRRVKERAEALKEMYDNKLVPIKQSMLDRRGHESKQLNGHHQKSENQLIFTGFERLNILLHDLERPVMIENTGREKFATAFFIVRFYMCKISKDLENYNTSFIKTLTDVNYNIINHVGNLPERLIYERFDGIWVKRTRRVQAKSQTAQSYYPVKQKPKFLEEIPHTAVESVHQAYFGKRSSQEKKKKDPRSRDTITKMTKSIVTIDDDTIEGFDPYADFSELVTNAANMTKKNLPDVKLPIIKPTSSNIILSNKTYEEKYLIVYTNLCAAIDATVSALETMSENKIPIPTLSELASCKVISPEATKRMVSSQSFDKVDSFDDYYQYLVNTYLKDPRTQDYFLGGKTIPIFDKTDDHSHRQSFLDLRNDDSWRSQEYIVTDIPEEDVKTVGVQTSETDDFIKGVSNILLRGDVVSHQLLEGIPVEEQGRAEEASEIFYLVGSSENIPEYKPSISEDNENYPIYEEIW